MVAAHNRFPNATTPFDWNEISLDFMRFSAFTFIDTILEPKMFEHVTDMCSTDLLKNNMYATQENSPLFGMIMTIDALISANAKSD